MNAVCPDIRAGQELMHLAAGEIHAIAEPRDGVTIACASGTVWVTQEGMGEDVVLEPGDSYRPMPHGKVVVQALETSTVEFG